MGHHPSSMLHYLRPSDFQYPDSVKRLFGNTLPLHLEVGFGGGHFWALQHELEGDVNYLGVEVSGVSVQKAISRYRASKVDNAVLTRVAAEFLIRNVLGENSLERVYLNFPDPWPKGKHEENRFVRAETFELLSKRLRDGGELWLTTDHAEYFEFALENATITQLFEINRTDPPSAALQTKYAQKWLAQGIEIQHARFKKLTSSHHEFAALEVFGGSMPHAIITGEFPAQPLEKTVLKGKNHTVILLEQYARADKLVVLARVEEPDFVQEALVSVSKREDGRIVAGLETFGSPLITAGVKAAVAGVVDWLERGGMTVLQRNY
jgi:tRNA (guanine-N7-)-methyltransferase